MLNTLPQIWLADFKNIIVLLRKLPFYETFEIWVAGVIYKCVPQINFEIWVAGVIYKCVPQIHIVTDGCGNIWINVTIEK